MAAGDLVTIRANMAENVSIWWRHHDIVSRTSTAKRFLSKYSGLRTIFNSLCLATPYGDTGSGNDITRSNVNLPSTRSCDIHSMEMFTWILNTSIYTFEIRDDVIKWKHFPHYWPFVWGIPGHRWIPLIKASDAELWCFLWSAPEQTVELTIEMPVIWDAIVLIITSLHHPGSYCLHDRRHPGVSRNSLLFIWHQ